MISRFFIRADLYLGENSHLYLYQTLLRSYSSLLVYELNKVRNYFKTETKK